MVWLSFGPAGYSTSRWSAAREAFPLVNSLETMAPQVLPGLPPAYAGPINQARFGVSNFQQKLSFALDDPHAAGAARAAARLRRPRRSCALVWFQVQVD